MAWTSPFTAVTGAIFTAAQWNASGRDNLNELWKYTTAGDIEYATSATTLVRLGIGGAGALMKSTGTAPSWLALGAEGTLMRSTGSDAAWLANGTAGQQLGISGGVSAWVDGVPGIFTAAGDLPYGSAADTVARLAVGSTGQYLGVTGGLPAWKNDGIPGIFQAAGDLVYGTAADTSARLAKPSASGLLKENSSGTPSWRDIKQTVCVQLVDTGSEVDNSVVGYFPIPSTMDGMNLARATAMVDTAGTTNPTTIQIRNLTKYPSNDALTTAISIASGGTVATAGVVNTSYDDVSTNDKIRIDVTGSSTTKALGLWVVLEYQLP